MKTIPSPRPKPSHQRPKKTIPSPRPKPSHQRPMKTTPSPRPKPAHQRPMKTIPSPRPNSIRKKNHASSFRPSAAASEPEDDLSRSNQGSDTRTKQTNPTPVLEFDRHLNPVPPSRHVPNFRSWNPQVATNGIKVSCDSNPHLADLLLLNTQLFPTAAELSLSAKAPGGGGMTKPTRGDLPNSLSSRSRRRASYFGQAQHHPRFCASSQASVSSRLQPAVRFHSASGKLRTMSSIANLGILVL